MKTFLASRLLLVVGALIAAPRSGAVDVPVQLLGGTPLGLDSGVSFGVPWPQAALSHSPDLSLTAGGRSLPVQSWPMAYWPDGSIKWTGVATVVPAGVSGSMMLAVAPQSAKGSVHVVHEGGKVTVDTGALTCVIADRGSALFESMSIGGRPVVGAANLVAILQTGPETDPEDAPPRERFVSLVKSVSVEQAGPVRAVVKIDGVHRGLASGREWLPFSVRLYFYSGQTAVRVVHTIVFDGDQEKDFVRGLGLQVSVPLREAVRNRTVRFGGPEGGLWSEPLQPGGGNAAQEAGEPFEGNASFGQNAVWDDFKLSQPNPNGFTIVKRTNPRSTWLFSNAGKRAPGFAYVGDLSGGLGLSIKNFWQSFPAGLEVEHAAGAAATLTAWLWSPDGPQMDMRHYDVKAHGLAAAYEDVQPGFSTAYGVSRTSELTLYPGAALPSRAQSVAMTQDGTERPLLTESPAYIHSTGVFGVWSLPDRSTPFLKDVEAGLDSVLAYYEQQVDDRSWYGFWQYGDFIHSYSAPRHTWHYDWGGHAWDNTELGTPLWLWYSYLRSGRADLFRLAEAHARNTSETNVYHLGDMKGLGSRHNVIKWGDGAKEARISQAAHWRFFYYLTTDERIGDIMHETAVASDLAVARYNPMREVSPPVAGEPVLPAHLRIGPDWFALAGDWMTEWERTGDVQWRDRIVAGVDSIMAMPYWLETGQPSWGRSATVSYDVTTHRLTAIRDPKAKVPLPAVYNLATIQGGGEVMFELIPLLGRKDFEQAWTQFCRIGNAPAEVLTRDRATGTEGADGRYAMVGQSAPRLDAWVYHETKSPVFLKLATTTMLATGASVAKPTEIAGANSLHPVGEDASIMTNEAAQTGLSIIEVLELCKDSLPTEVAIRPVRRARRPAGDRPAPGGSNE